MKKITIITCLTAMALEACAPRYVSDEEAARRRDVRHSERRQTVIDALAGGDGPITLHGVAGNKTAIINVGMDEVEVCGHAIKIKAVYADWTSATQEYPGGMRLDDPTKPMKVCFKYSGFYRATPGSF